MAEGISRETIEQELVEACERLQALEIDIERSRRVVAHLAGLLAGVLAATPSQGKAD